MICGGLPPGSGDGPVAAGQDGSAGLLGAAIEDGTGTREGQERAGVARHAGERLLVVLHVRARKGRRPG